MILEEGQVKRARKNLLILGEERLGPACEAVKDQLADVKDLKQLDHMFRRALRAASWQEILAVVCAIPMYESDTYLMILDEGQAKQARKAILLVGESRLGPPEESVKVRLDGVQDLEHLDRILRRAVKAASWQEILETP
jgi:hypothetical protein